MLEKIVRSAVKIYNEALAEDVIYTGIRHCDIYERLHNLGYHEAIVRGVEGFVLNTGKFLTREEAASFAYRNGQLNKKVGVLYSEDLW